MLAKLQTGLEPLQSSAFASAKQARQPQVHLAQRHMDCTFSVSRIYRQRRLEFPSDRSDHAKAVEGALQTRQLPGVSPHPEMAFNPIRICGDRLFSRVRARLIHL